MRNRADDAAARGLGQFGTAARGLGRFGAVARHVFMDLSPLRRSADFRAFIGGQLVSTLGNQLTAVAVPYQVYRLTHSSLYVGLVSLTQLFPLVGASLVGGSLVDAVDRRRLLLVTQLLMATCSAGLAVNADLSSALWPLFVCPALTAGLGGVDSAARNAMVPGMVGLRDVPAANAMFQALFQLGAVAGPAAAGLLLAGAGIRVVYWVDVASFAASLLAVFFISPQPPGGAARRPGLRSIAEGFRFVRGHQAVQGAYLIDLNAMVFGLPRALFPALAATVFGGGASTVGLLYAAPGAGALLGAVTTGWVGRIRRQGLAVIAAVIVWGLAITGFGLVKWLPAALALLAVAGWADVISAVFRNTIIQLSVPDALRGRLMGVQMAVVAGGPRLGDLEAGAAATAFGDTVAVVSGGLACVAGAVVLARLLPGFRRQRIRYEVPSGPIDGTANGPANVPGTRPAPDSRGLPLADASFCGGLLACARRPGRTRWKKSASRKGGRRFPAPFLP
ncbi:MAG: MFS transporter [Streptosporangiaceae bacterium]|nr:MFS transporter [Streptosporangiaceae bacterium]